MQRDGMDYHISAEIYLSAFNSQVVRVGFVSTTFCLLDFGGGQGCTNPISVL